MKSDHNLNSCVIYLMTNVPIAQCFPRLARIIYAIPSTYQAYAVLYDCFIDCLLCAMCAEQRQRQKSHNKLALINKTHDWYSA